ncbi:hypothetical protein HCN51_05070 [Nonomuraea sp. FMUSA5-5]|uniref:Glycosyltransferase n=1 Tax=Nonomuraea composti TaxID=2720023 RepID=A0ABX1B0X2_9ACTN|nr:hypothetical protein [Nonomuraea sp. FMUSA5-5]NJP88833.1 hypothetical protein [Nonomuraea sp. FMUSA5-5]
MITPRRGAPAVRRVAGEAARVEVCRDYPDDYLGQQVTKLHADDYTDAQLICHLDADMMIDRPCDPGLLMAGRRIRLVCLPVSALGRHRPWTGPTERFLGRPVEHDYMRVPPFVYPRELYPAVRAHCRAVHGMSVEAYVTSRPPRGFSEFNVLGAGAHLWLPDRFAFVDERSPDRPPALCRWYWSRGGLDDALRRELAEVTGGPREV